MAVNKCEDTSRYDYMGWKKRETGGRGQRAGR